MSKQNENATLVFLHIPKTAGTTFKSILVRHYMPYRIFTFYQQWHHKSRLDLLCDQMKNGARIDVVIGHIGYGLHEHLPKSVEYITVLREPVSRVVSMYKHIRRQSKHPLHAQVNSMTLKQYVESDIDESVENAQVRFLSGVKFNNEIAGQDELINCGDGGCEKMLENAKDVLSNHIELFGLSERFEQMLVMLRARYGWKDVYYADMNKSKSGDTSVIDADVIDIIVSRNKLDIEFYKYAQILFEEKYNSLNIDKEAELSEIRRNSKRYGVWLSRSARLLEKCLAK